ncbi:MAG TPA: hypothetical protein VFG91_11300 [Woeseiaceae bacterium]|nr:hypothetical protein [Woeseiaceae bacterium]
MNRFLQTTIVCAVMVAAVQAFAAATGAPPPASAAPTSFARIANDAHGRPTALQLAIVSYAPEDEAYTVDLISAIHVGDAAYYQDLNERFRAYDVLLYEMIVPGDDSQPGGSADKGAGGLGLITLMQNGLKDLLGLTYQLDGIDYDAANFVHADMTSAMLAESMEARDESLYVYFWRAFFAAVDDYGRDPLGLEDWQRLSVAITSGRGNALKIALAHDLVTTSFSADVFGGENGSALIEARNEHAFGVLKEQLEAGNRRIGIFYGAAHMPDFERRLVNDLGLEKTAIEWIDAWRFSPAKPAL